MLEVVANEMAAHLDWLTSHGATDFHENYFDYDGSYAPEYPELFPSDDVWKSCLGSILFDGGEDGTGYTHPQLFMVDKVAEYADVITHKLNAPATSLVQDSQTKEILGVVYDDNDLTAQKPLRDFAQRLLAEEALKAFRTPNEKHLLIVLLMSQIATVTDSSTQTCEGPAARSRCKAFKGWGKRASKSIEAGGVRFRAQLLVTG